MIKQEIINYRNLNPQTRIVLGTILGEFDRISKDPSDQECLKVIKKMIESNILTGQIEENELLSKFIPKQMSDLEIIAIIENNNFANIGECMKFFSSNFTGLYDGKKVSKYFNENKK